MILNWTYIWTVGLLAALLALELVPDVVSAPLVVPERGQGHVCFFAVLALFLLLVEMDATDMLLQQVVGIEDFFADVARKLFLLDVLIVNVEPQIGFLPELLLAESTLELARFGRLRSEKQ